MLRGVPRRALEQIVAGLGAVVHLDDPLELSWRCPFEPSTDAAAHERAVARDRGAVVQVGGRLVEQPRLRELAEIHAVDEREREPEHVIAQVSERPVALGGTPVEMTIRNVADQLLSRVEHDVEPLGEHGRGQLQRRRVRDAQELRVGRRVPSLRGAIADGQRRDTHDAQARQLLVAFRVGLHVDRVELDPPRREELLRLGAGRSARPVEVPGFRFGNPRGAPVGHRTLLKRSVNDCTRGRRGATRVSARETSASVFGRRRSPRS